MTYFRSVGGFVLQQMVLCLLIGNAAAWAVPKIANLNGEPVTVAALDALMKSGPHALIRAFLVEPAYVQSKFIGFRVVKRMPHPVLADNAHVSVGDIVVSANGVRLESPGQFMAAWGKLKSLKRFSVVLMRKQERITLKWYLEDTKRP